MVSRELPLMPRDKNRFKKIHQLRGVIEVRAKSRLRTLNGSGIPTSEGALASEGAPTDGRVWIDEEVPTDEQVSNGAGVLIDSEVPICCKIKFSSCN